MTASDPTLVTTGAGRPLMQSIAGRLSRNLIPSILLLLVVLAGLPIAVWLDMRNLSEQALRGQAAELMTMLDGIRGYYAGNVVARVLANGGTTHSFPTMSMCPAAFPSPPRSPSSSAA